MRCGGYLRVSARGLRHRARDRGAPASRSRTARRGGPARSGDGPRTEPQLGGVQRGRQAASAVVLGETVVIAYMRGVRNGLHLRGGGARDSPCTDGGGVRDGRAPPEAASGTAAQRGR